VAPASPCTSLCQLDRLQQWALCWALWSLGGVAQVVVVVLACMRGVQVLRTLLMRGMRLAPGVLGSALGKAVVAYRWEAAQVGPVSQPAS
jgi:hypothetical protein